MKIYIISYGQSCLSMNSEAACHEPPLNRRGIWALSLAHQQLSLVFFQKTITMGHLSGGVGEISIVCTSLASFDGWILPSDGWILPWAKTIGV